VQETFLKNHYFRSIKLKTHIMKKLVIASIIFLGSVMPGLAQTNGQALGLRFGGGSGAFTEISYQQPLKLNRLEFNLGLNNSNHWNSWGLTGLYQWVMPIEGGFDWYLGIGPSIGYWDEKDDDRYESDGGMFLAAALNAGIEYHFTEIPLQVALDFRPELGLINRWDAVGGGLGFAVRYVF
jgi:hypothetical protein